MKAAIAISRASDNENKFKDEIISKLQKELHEVKSQYFKEVS